MKLTVDQKKCVASGQCVLSAPGVFDQRDEDAIVVLLQPSPPEGLSEEIKQAAALCPALAITVED